MTVAHAGSASLYPTVRAAGLTTARSSLDLLELPYPFSQVHLLTVSEFAGMAGKRRGRAGRRLPPVNEQVLEELHRCGVLVPLFRVDLEHAPDARAIDVSASVTPSNVHATIITELYRAAEDMRLIGPGCGWLCALAEGAAADPLAGNRKRLPVLAVPVARPGNGARVRGRPQGPGGGRAT